jgi:hypothetical protein
MPGMYTEVGFFARFFLFWLRMHKVETVGFDLLSG